MLLPNCWVCKTATLCLQVMPYPVKRCCLTPFRTVSSNVWEVDFWKYVLWQHTHVSCLIWVSENVFFTFNLCYLLVFHFTQGHCVLRVISTSLSQTGESPPDNFIGFDSAPDKVLDGSVVRVRYQCSGPCQLAVEVVVSTLRKIDLAVFRRKWISSTPRVHRVRQVLLRLPPSVLYQQDFFNRRVLDAQNVTVRAWLDHLNDGSEPGTYHGSMFRIYKVLQIKPLSERPTRPPTECPSWSAQLMWQMTRNRIHQCPHESGQSLHRIFKHCPRPIFITQTFIIVWVCNLLLFYLYIDIINMLKFPLASTGEHFGVVRRFQPFIDRVLEGARLHAVTQPRLD